MHIEPFRLERFFARHEFKVKHLLSASDSESLTMTEVLALAQPEVFRLWQGLKLGYTESPGHPCLREAVAGLYESVTREDIVVTVPEEGIFIAMQALLEPGDHVIAIHPAYQSLHAVAQTIGCEVTPWGLDLTEHGWRLDLERLEHSLTDRTRLIVINFPHNPTGFLPALDELEAVIALARRRGIHIFSDEMYRLMEYDSTRRLPAMCDAYEHGISLAGLSKAFGLPGLRIGWLATRDRSLIERWLIWKDYTTICSSAPSEILGVMALQAREPILARTMAITRENLQRAVAFFAARPDLFRWIGPQAGSVAFPAWRGTNDVRALCQALLDREVLVVPGILFGYAGTHFRVGLGRKDFPQALTILGEYVQDRYPQSF